MTTKTESIDCLCFSKDRPFQLDGYIRSLQRFVQCKVNLTVLYKSTDPEIKEGFESLKQEHPQVSFVAETDYGTQVFNWINAVETDLAFFGCDDVIFYRPVDFNQVTNTFQIEPGLLGFSLRLGANIQFNHTRDTQVPQPEFQQRNPLLIWDWKGQHADWGYPFELNGTIYRTELIKLIFNAMENLRTQSPQLDWRHPNYTETAGNQILRTAQSVPRKMASFTESCLVVPTVNQVQNIAWNHIMGEIRSVRDLEQSRRKGQCLDLDAYAKASFDRIHVGDFFTTTKDIV